MRAILVLLLFFSWWAIAGTVTVPTRSSGQVIQPEFFNTVKSALTTDFVPRNISGVATDEGGKLGTDVYRWQDAFVSRYIYVGDADELNRISGLTSGKLLFQINGTTEVQIDSDGLDGAGIKDASVSNAKLATNAVANSNVADAAINTAELVDGAVTRTKTAVYYTLGSVATDTNVTNGETKILTNIPATGRPVRVTLYEGAWEAARTAGTFTLTVTLEYSPDNSSWSTIGQPVYISTTATRLALHGGHSTQSPAAYSVGDTLAAPAIAIHTPSAGVAYYRLNCAVSGSGTAQIKAALAFIVEEL